MQQLSGEETDRRLLTDFDLMVVLAILTLEEVASEKVATSAAVARGILRVGGCRIAARRIHAALKVLERDGLVMSVVRDPASSRKRSAKQIFEVTPAGLRAVKTTQRTLVSLWEGLPELKNEPLLGELVGESGAHPSTVWLWYMTTRVQQAPPSRDR